MLKPPAHFDRIDDRLDFALSARMGCLILAGGQASRLGIDGPKGCIPVTVVKNKSLFQVFLEKAAYANKREQKPLYVAIMTSPTNHEQTVSFLKTHHFFGFPEKQLSFFQQSMLPLTDQDGKELDVWGPDGNGKALHHFYHAGIWKKWKEQGITCVNVIPIDNPLADPFDSKIVFHDEDVIIKAIPREFPEEKVGLLAIENGSIKIVEYTELTETMRVERCADGSLLFPLANSGLLCFSIDFIEKIKDVVLPLHCQSKTVKLDGKVKQIFKYEHFIFDLLSFSKKTKVLLYPREMTFAPLKNKEGEDDIHAVQRALLERDRTIFYQVTGVVPPTETFELDFGFYYPVKKLIEKWRGKSLPNNAYIEP